MLHVFEQTMVARMPAKQLPVVHLVAEEIGVMLVVVAIVARWRIEIHDGHQTPIGQQGIAASGNLEQILWVAQVEAEAEDDEIDGFYLGQTIGGPHGEMQPWIAR
ncbi:hypothetical protein D3C72_2195460 [compost metagenome]